jgi:hypothetical protein
MSERSWSHEALPHQTNIQQEAIMACNPVAVLPGMENDVTRLITGIPTIKIKQIGKNAITKI